MAGYSGTPLPKKLGIKAGHLVVIDAAPESWLGIWPVSHGVLPDGARVVVGGRQGNADIVLAFFVETGGG